jgi:hypothetical protein
MLRLGVRSPSAPLIQVPRNAGGLSLFRLDDPACPPQPSSQEKPADGLPWIKETFGLDVSPEMFSASKSKIKSEQGGGKPPRGKPGRKPSAAAVKPDRKPAGGVPSGLADTLATLRGIVRDIGPEEAHKLVDLFGGGHQRHC